MKQRDPFTAFARTILFPGFLLLSVGNATSQTLPAAGQSQEDLLPAAAAPARAPAPAAARSALGSTVILGWNDLGMHCMNRSFSDLCILPPFNNLWVQVIQRGNPPRLLSEGVDLTYRFPANTTSSSKVNFWTYAPSLFGASLPADVGLTGHGLTGSLEYNGTAWEVTGVPITPFDDATPTTEQPYQLAEVTCLEAGGATVLDQTVFVAPVSTEMHCDKCHGATPEIHILQEHDKEHGTTLMSQRPVLCASCHASNALGTTGQPGLPNLSRAIHKYHGEEVGATMNCYDCHPGAQTQCLRGAMFLAGKSCADCHGNMLSVGSSSRRPWIDEPRCATCHPEHPEETGKLYRQSRGHGGLYCAACHNSPHAELPTAQPRDAMQALRVQGRATFIRDCSVCHSTRPSGPGPHGLLAPSTPSGWTLR